MQDAIDVLELGTRRGTRRSPCRVEQAAGRAARAADELREARERQRIALHVRERGLAVDVDVDVPG